MTPSPTGYTYVRWGHAEQDVLTASQVADISEALHDLHTPARHATLYQVRHAVERMLAYRMQIIITYHR